MKLKKTASLLLSAFLLAGAVSIPALAADGQAPVLISPAPAAGCVVEIDGASTGINACVMVPLRPVAEKLGFTVTWNGDGAITVDNGRMKADITLGSPTFQAITGIEGAQGATAPLDMGMAPYCVDGATYVPVELFNVLLGSGAVSLEAGKVVISTRSPHEETQIANPFHSCADLAEAAGITGFSLRAPDGYVSVQTMGETLFQVRYADGMLIRKAVGSGDISGDYNTYTQVKTVDGVTLKGDHDRFSLAMWTAGGYTYSITVGNALSGDAMAALAAGVN